MFLYTTERPKSYFHFEIIINVLVSFFPLISLHMLCGYNHYKYFAFSARDRLHTSESNIHKRHILTYKDGLCTERVNVSSHNDSDQLSDNTNMCEYCEYTYNTGYYRDPTDCRHFYMCTRVEKGKGKGKKYLYTSAR